MRHQLSNVNGLGSSLFSHEIQPSTKSAILSGLLGLAIDCGKSDRISDFDAYIAYYRRQCITALHDNGRHVSVKTHRDIIQVADQVKLNKTLEEIRVLLGSKTPGPNPMKAAEMVNSSIDLTVHLLLMMDIGELKFGFRGQAPLVWTSGTLKEWAREHFTNPRRLDPTGIRLETLFNARNLQRIAGFEIQWTDNLADHLRIISEEHKQVAIFHHASFLESQREKY